MLHAEGRVYRIRQRFIYIGLQLKWKYLFELKRLLIYIYLYIYRKKRMLLHENNLVSQSSVSLNTKNVSDQPCLNIALVRAQSRH